MEEKVREDTREEDRQTEDRKRGPVRGEGVYEGEKCQNHFTQPAL